MLLLGHFVPMPGINFGVVGVNLFVVFSGVLMSKLLFVNHTPIPTFYKRRTSRIVPAHVAFLVSLVVYFAVMGLWSFSIYLWQQPFFLAVDHHNLPTPWALLMALGAGLIAFYGLEQPVRRTLNRVWAPTA